LIELTQDTLDYLVKCSKKERDYIYAEIGRTEWDRCRDDMVYWLDPSKHLLPYVYTRDPMPLYECIRCADDIGRPFDKLHTHLESFHDIVEDNAMPYFTELPTDRVWTLFPYHEPIIRTWLREKILFIEKSRDMMTTWLVVAMYTWDTLFHKNRENIFQSDDSTKTADLVERAYFIWNNMPTFLKRYEATYASGQTRSGILRVPELASVILGFPSGPDQIRQYHPSGVFADEAAFQPEAEAAFMALKPAIQAGGRYTAVSSANPGYFHAACRDIIL
jgi:hypothetical protein